MEGNWPSEGDTKAVEARGSMVPNKLIKLAEKIVSVPSHAMYGFCMGQELD